MCMQGGVARYEHRVSRNENGLITNLQRLWVGVGSLDYSDRAVEADRLILRLGGVLLVGWDCRSGQA